MNHLCCRFQHDLDEQQRQRDQENRTLGQKFKLYTLRVIINLFVVAVLAGACYLIYWTSLKALDVSWSGRVPLLPFPWMLGIVVGCYELTC